MKNFTKLALIGALISIPSLTITNDPNKKIFRDAAAVGDAVAFGTFAGVLSKFIYGSGRAAGIVVYGCYASAKDPSLLKEHQKFAKEIYRRIQTRNRFTGLIAPAITGLYVCGSTLHSNVKEARSREAFISYAQKNK